LWSFVAFSPGADKVAVSSEKKVNYDPGTGDISVTLEMKNMAGYPLAARDEGSFVQWWDDEHPVTETSFFTTDRVPNGTVAVTLSSQTELKDGPTKLIYSGRLSRASLVPRSFGAFDFMGGPEVPPPTTQEIAATRDSFEEIKKGYRRGRIELVFRGNTRRNRLKACCGFAS
jgi:hypothetical protein